MRIVTTIGVWIYLIFQPYITNGQSLHDLTWIIGYNGGPETDLEYGGSVIDFREDPPKVVRLPLPFTMIRANAQICNEKGDLQFYSNGCRIIGYPQFDLPNGDSLNPGRVHNIDCTQGPFEVEYNGHQSMVTLPWPERPDIYAILHLGIEYKIYQEPPYGHKYVNNLYLTEVDMRLNDGKGDVVSKNNLIHQDTFITSTKAVRHGNGRDWWIVVPKLKSNLFFIYLFDPTGIRLVKQQAIGDSSNSAWFVGQAQFSNDGTRFARIAQINNVNTQIDIYDFDRCAGAFFCAKRIPQPTEAGVLSLGFSPNGRFLYATEPLSMHQFDLWAPDIFASKVLISVFDPSIDGVFGHFFMPKLAPNGKIYVTTTGSMKALHVINNPDEKGLACNFVKFGLPLPTRISHGVPNHPNFRLYDLPGSPCDSLGINAPEGFKTPWHPVDQIRISPNPVSTIAQIALPPACQQGQSVQLYTISGVFVQDLPIVERNNNLEIDCSNLPAGVYIATMKSPESKKPFSAKLVKMHYGV